MAGETESASLGIGAKTNEIPESAPLLDQVDDGDLARAAITADALHAQTRPKARLPPSRIRSGAMSSLAPVRMPYASYREVNSVGRPCSAASTVPHVSRGVSPPEAGFWTARSPRAPGRLSPAWQCRSDTEDAPRICPP